MVYQLLAEIGRNAFDVAQSCASRRVLIVSVLMAAIVLSGLAMRMLDRLVDASNVWRSPTTEG